MLQYWCLSSASVFMLLSFRRVGTKSALHVHRKEIRHVESLWQLTLWTCFVSKVFRLFLYTSLSIWFSYASCGIRVQLILNSIQEVVCQPTLVLHLLLNYNQMWINQTSLMSTKVITHTKNGNCTAPSLECCNLVTTGGPFLFLYL